MSTAVANAARLKPEVRLAQAVSEFESELSDAEKKILRGQKVRLQSTPPDGNDVIRLVTEFDKPAGIVAGRQCYGPRLFQFVQAVQQFASLGDVIVGGSQNLIACGVWMLIRMSILSIATHSSYLDKISDLFMNVGRSAPCYQSMAVLYPQSRRLQADLAEYFIVAVDLCRHIWKFAKRTAVSRYISTLGDADLKRFESDLRRWGAAIKEEVLMLMAKNLKDTRSEITSIKTLVTKGSTFVSHQVSLQTRLRILDLCSTYPFSTTWKQIRKLGHCSLYHNQVVYQAWRGQAVSTTLIYRGKVGSGKSVLLANIVGDLVTNVTQKSNIIAYFFCRHDLPESLKARTILGSLTRQLLLHVPDIALSQTSVDGATVTLDEEDLERLLGCIVPKDQAAYVVLDGLDECDSSCRATVFEWLEKLQKTMVLHLCLSIRLDPTKNQDQNFHSFAGVSTFTTPDDNPDIETFVDTEIANLVSSRKLRLADPNVKSEIRRKLIEGSQGMFLWVALQLRSLSALRNDDQIRQALENLPKDLSETFTRILDKVEPQDLNFQNSILEFVATAFQPLSLEQLREALSIVPGDTVWKASRLITDIEATLACCGGLIILDEEETTVRVVHHSFKQFLESGREGFSLSLGHRNVADKIVSYLNYGVFDTQISSTTVAKLEVGTAPSHILQTVARSSALPKIALNMSNSKRKPAFDMGKTITDIRGHFDKTSSRRFEFYEYATSFCVPHVLNTVGHRLRFDTLLARLIERRLIAGKSANEDKQLLWFAASAGYESVIRVYMHMGNFDISMTRKDDGAPKSLLLSAAQNGHMSLVALLLDTYDEKIDASALRLAVENGHSAVVKLLLQKTTAAVNPSLLRAAVHRGNADVVRLLLDTGKADADTMMLWMAAKKGYETVVSLLLQTGQIAVDTGMLHAAVESGSVAIVQMLLETRGVGVDATTLRLAVTTGCTDMVQLLLRVGKVDIDEKMLRLAADNGHDDVLQVLRQARLVAIQEESRPGRSPLMDAVREGNLAMIQALLGSWESDNNFGMLCLAAQEGHEAIVRLLLDNTEVNVDGTDRFGRTPLSIAHEYGHASVVRLLLGYGDVNHT